jgi:hypothetical protein
MGRMAVLRYSSTYSKPPHYMDVSGQLHTPATLHLWIGGWADPQSLSGRFAERQTPPPKVQFRSVSLLPSTDECHTLALGISNLRQIAVEPALQTQNTFFLGFYRVLRTPHPVLWPIDLRSIVRTQRIAWQFGLTGFNWHGLDTRIIQFFVTLTSARNNTSTFR